MLTRLGAMSKTHVSTPISFNFVPKSTMDTKKLHLKVDNHSLIGFLTLLASSGPYGPFLAIQRAFIIRYWQINVRRQISGRQMSNRHMSTSAIIFLPSADSILCKFKIVDGDVTVVALTLIWKTLPRAFRGRSGSAVLWQTFSSTPI